MKILFDDIKAKLKATEGVRHAGLFRNQFRLLEEDKQIPFRTPAVFIEFQNVTYDTNPMKTQNGQGNIRLYLAEFHLKQTDEAFFNMRESVHASIQGLKDHDNEYSSLMRVAENPDPDFAGLTVWTIDYAVQWRDNSAKDAVVEKIITDLQIIVNV